MTTIAYKDGVLAGDSLLTCGSLKLPEIINKVFKLSDGRLFAAAGEWRCVLKVRRALEDDAPTPAIKEFEAVLVEPDGTLLSYDKGEWNAMDTPYVALGTGAYFAYAAMWLGYNAVTAVKAGIQFDKNSGGAVRTVKLKRNK